jgi:cardiolipin synthase A/B
VEDRLDEARGPVERKYGCRKLLRGPNRQGLQLAVVTALLLAGCGSLPRINPDLAVRSTRSIQMEGARGPLTNQQSQAVLAKLKHGADDTNIFNRHLALMEETGGGPLVVGNKVEALIDGPTTYRSMFSAIGSAKNHINLETYILETDEIGQRFIDALLEKQRAGVQVNLIYDSVGSLATPKEFFQLLIDAGAHVLEYNPVNPLKARKSWELNERDHRKLLVVDGKIAFVGGINISSVYSTGSFPSRGSGKKARKKGDVVWRDTHLRMEGPVVAEFQKLFLATWEQQTGDALGGPDHYPQLSHVGREVVRAIGSSPGDPQSLIYVTLLSAIRSAETRVFITNAYFIPDPQLLAALKAAAARGADVQLLLPGQSDSDLVLYASRSFFQELLSSGVKIHERQEALLHAKTATIDGVWSTIGSTNLDWRSFLHNQEIDAVILGQDFGGRMEAMFARDLESSKEIVLEDWKKRSLTHRLKETGARLWARFL